MLVGNSLYERHAEADGPWTDGRGAWTGTASKHGFLQGLYQP